MASTCWWKIFCREAEFRANTAHNKYLIILKLKLRISSQASTTTTENLKASGAWSSSRWAGPTWPRSKSTKIFLRSLLRCPRTKCKLWKYSRQTSLVDWRRPNANSYLSSTPKSTTNATSYRRKAANKLSRSSLSHTWSRRWSPSWDSSQVSTCSFSGSWKARTSSMK